MNGINDPRDPESPAFLAIRKATLQRFREAPVQLWHSLQYVLCEIGVPQERVDPRTIEPAFQIRGTNLLLDSKRNPRPWTSLDGLYVSPELTDAQAENYTRDAMDKLTRLSRLLAEKDVKGVGENVIRGLRLSTQPIKLDSSRKVHLGGDVGISVGETILDLSEIAGLPILALVTNDPEWVYPDDPRIWTHFARCQEERAIAVFIARKISIATFPLFKYMSAIGIQFHQLLIREDLSEEARIIALDLDWLNIAPLEKIAQNPGLQIIRKQLGGKTRSFGLQAAYASILPAEQAGLMENSTAGAIALQNWAQQSPIPLPQKWADTVKHWVAWEEMGLLRKPYLPAKT